VPRHLGEREVHRVVRGEVVAQPPDSLEKRLVRVPRDVERGKVRERVPGRRRTARSRRDVRYRHSFVAIVVTVMVGLVLDCRDPGALAPFWAAALGYVVAGGVENYVMLLPDGREGPKLLLQGVPEAKTTKSRMHLDLHVLDVDAEVARLVALGARRLEDAPRNEHGHTWVLMADPEGNEFCIVHAGGDG
jgi:predicted enzyme related to lactoylglutathione lyase